MRIISSISSSVTSVELQLDGLGKQLPAVCCAKWTGLGGSSGPTTSSPIRARMCEILSSEGDALLVCLRARAVQPPSLWTELRSPDLNLEWGAAVQPPTAQDAPTPPVVAQTKRFLSKSKVLKASVSVVPMTSKYN